MGLPRIECVILAAGSSNRLGRDKALIRIGAGTLVEWLSERVSNRGVGHCGGKQDEPWRDICQDSRI